MSQSELDAVLAKGRVKVTWYDLEQGTRSRQPARLPLQAGAPSAGEAADIQRPPAASLPVPTETEQRAESMLSALGMDILQRQYGVALGDCTYTADMLIAGRDGRKYLVEVKGKKRLGSAGRSRLGWLWAMEKTGLPGLWVERRKAVRGRPEHWRVEVHGKGVDW